ncbi:MAG: Stk1 family PASTA domain-containing Ser/Thr kinase [Anaerolineae bacterium]|nr:Stk1 family PASTA domain-containing Ser/Thr kinase [Anaerolineae bacterium]
MNNRYQLLELVGSGGMAVVYKGVDSLLHRPVAIKILREAYASDPAFLARFQTEARSAAQLDHPNVVTVYDVGQDGNRHYIVMEYVDGEDLKSLIRREGRLGVDRAVDIATQIAAGVGHAHKTGIIHCDIKPQNVMVTREGVVKVTDFGIARALSESGLTDPDVVWGSPLYFSPEQAAGERPSPASDVYSIGVVLYEMLAGVPPFQAEKPTALALKHIREEPKPLAAMNSQVPSQLEWITRKLLAKEPSTRYRTADQLAMVLLKYQQQGEQATRLYSRVDMAEEVTGSTAPVRPAAARRGAESNWLTWLLGGIATIAVVGLIPLWALVYREWTRSSAIPTAPPLLPTAAATATMVVVPDVQGRLWEEARDEIQTLGLLFVLEEQAGAESPEGTIVRQDPPPGTPVIVGTQVTLYIAGPPEMVEVPGVTQVPLEMARTWLEQAGLQVVEEVIWSTEPISTVISQDPERGGEVQAGSIVTLTVSGGVEIPIEIQANLANLVVLEQVELREVQFRPGELVAVSLRWRALANISERYVVFVHVIGPDGDLIAQEDVEPLQGARPTNGWVAGLILWDAHQIRLPANVPAERYQLRAGMYPQGQPSFRLPVVDPGETTVELDSILLAEIEIRP